MTTLRLLCVVSACIGLAAASLWIADEPVYDAWAWLVWGRELAELGLDTTSGPSWKPLPVLIAVPLSLAGDAAPQLWLVLVRAAWLLSFVLAAELAHGLTSERPRRVRIAAGAFAALALALLYDDVAAWGRQAAGGMSEPLLVALVLAAARLALARRPRATLGLLALAGLLRPEAALLLGAYAAWAWRAEPRVRPLAVAIAVAVPACWLAPELLGSGGGGTGRAQRGTGSPDEALWWAAGLPLAVTWPLACLACLAALQRGAVRALAAAALGWIALVAAMTLLGFPGLARFVAPAAAILGVLGGVGLAALLDRPRAGPRSPGAAAFAAVLVLALAVTAVGLPGRVGDLAQAWRSSARISDSHERLRAVVVAAGGRRTLLRCGRLATSDVLVRTGLAWQLGVSLSEVVSFGTPSRRSGAFVIGLQASPGLRHEMLGAGGLLARHGEWSVRSVACPVTDSSPSASSAGVSGAER